MKALRFHDREDLRVETIAEPGALGPHEVRLANSFCGICGTDLHEYKHGPIFVPREAHPLTGGKLPQILGHEFAGKVIEIGSAVTQIALGERVSVMPHVAPASDPFVRRGETQNSPQLAIIGLMTPWGGMAEQAIVPEFNVFKLPDGVSDEQGAAVEPAAVVVHAVDRGGVHAGSSVLINGAGPIGALATLAARAAGATTIVVLEPNARRRAWVEKMGVITLAIAPEPDAIAAAIAKYTEDGLGFDVAIECVGHEAALAADILAVRRGGVIVQVGLATKPVSVDLSTLVIKDISLRASWCYPPTIWPRVINMIAAGALPVEKVISARLSLDEAIKGGFDELLRPGSEAMKILIRTAA